jgi:hypothetical protein
MGEVGTLVDRLLGEPLSLVALGPKGQDLRIPEDIRV